MDQKERRFKPVSNINMQFTEGVGLRAHRRWLDRPRLAQQGWFGLQRIAVSLSRDAFW